MLATQYAEWHDIEAQKEGESDVEFRERVAGELRDKGNIIEAHEVQSDARWDDTGGDAMTGILGAVAMAAQGIDYGQSGSSRVGDEMAAGVIASDDKPKMSSTEAMIAMLLFAGK